MNIAVTDAAPENKQVILPPKIEAGFSQGRRSMAEAGPAGRLGAFDEICRWAATRTAVDNLVKADVVAKLESTARAAQLDADDARAAMAAAFRTIEAKPGTDEQDQPEEKKELWPAPLAEAAYLGIAGELVRAIGPHTEADDVAVLLQFLAAFGNVCHRHAHLRIEGDRHPAQLWPVLVGRTAKGRKGTSWGRVRQVIAEVDPRWAAEKIVSGLSTGEGLVYAVRDPVVSSSNKEGEKEIDPGVDDKRLLVVESEFASPLRHMERGGNILSSTLRALWDSGSVGSLTKNSPTRTTDSLVTVIGHVTDDELRRYLTRTERANGLANRFVFAMVKRSKVLPFGGSEFNPEPFVARLKEARARAWPDQQIRWHRDGAALWTSVYERLSEGKAGMAGAVTSRAETQVLRLALIYSLLDPGADGRIDADHLRAALAVWKYCEQSARIIFGATTGNPLADDILKMLTPSSEGLTRTAIYNAFDRHKSAQAIASALQELAAAGLARWESTPTKGRPEERWFAT